MRPLEVIGFSEDFGRLIGSRIVIPCQYPTDFRDDMVRRMLVGESLSGLAIVF